MSKETVKEYLEIINTKIWHDIKMQKYVKSRVSDVFKTSNGNYFEFEKPYIKKDFCFGYGMNGISSDEQETGAFDMVDIAKNDASYFIKENLKDFDEKIKNIAKANEVFLLPKHNEAKNITWLATDEYFLYYPSYKEKVIEKLSDDDKKELLKMYESEKQKFVKRLQTYLKKYGLTKIHSWSFLVD